MNNKPKLVTLGRLGATHGVRGWIRIQSYTEQDSDIFNYSNWLIKVGSEIKQIKVLEWKHHFNHLVCRLENINSIEQAKELNNAYVYVNANELPELSDDYYWIDLIGCTVINQDNYELGKVVKIMETGANDVLVLKANANDQFNMKERLVPFIPDQFILNVDLEKKVILANWDPEF